MNLAKVLPVLPWWEFTLLCYVLVDPLPVPQLDRPLLKDVMMEYRNPSRDTYLIENEWEQIGIQLEVADEELEKIRRRHTSKYSHNNTLAFQDMIRVWVKQENPPPTWLSLVEAFERLKIHPTLASRLRSKYCKYSNIIIV